MINPYTCSMGTMINLGATEAKGLNRSPICHTPFLFVKCILRHFVTCISIAWRYCLDTKEYNLVQRIWYTSENKIKPKNTKYSKEYNILQRIQNTPKNTRYSKEYKILQRIQNTPKNTKYSKDYKILQRIQHTTKNTKCSKEYKILQVI